MDGYGPGEAAQNCRPKWFSTGHLSRLHAYIWPHHETKSVQVITALRRGMEKIPEAGLAGDRASSAGTGSPGGEARVGDVGCGQNSRGNAGHIGSIQRFTIIQCAPPPLGILRGDHFYLRNGLLWASCLFWMVRGGIIRLRESLAQFAGAVRYQLLSGNVDLRNLACHPVSIDHRQLI